MELADLVIPTGIARPGMTVAQVFTECVTAGVPGVPFQDAEGNITGKASIRHILKETCIPDFLVRHSYLLGNEIRHLTIPDSHVHKVLALKVDPLILSQIAVASPTTPLAKALAIMENMHTTYLFIIDNGTYHGVVSIMAIARAMMEAG
jgi:CBS domain-containing protein